jgi:hypothetical protein
MKKLTKHLNIADKESFGGNKMSENPSADEIMEQFMKQRTIDKAMEDYKTHGIETICGNGQAEKLEIEKVFPAASTRRILDSLNSDLGQFMADTEARG